MDHTPISEFSDASPAAAGAPPEWDTPVVIGVEGSDVTAEAAGDAAQGYTDDTDTAVLGVGYDETHEDTTDDETVHGLGALSVPAAAASTGDYNARPVNGHDPASHDSDTPASADAPRPGDGIDDVPPELPPLETTGEEPERGRALHDVVQYAEDVNNTVGEQTANTVLAEYDREEIERYQVDRDLETFEDAVESLGHVDREDTRADSSDTTGHIYGDLEEVGGTSIRSDVIGEEMEAGELLYGDRMEAAGVKLDTDGEDIYLAMEDPGHFTEAVGQMPPATDETEQAAINNQMNAVVDSGLSRAAIALVVDNPDQAFAAVGYHPPADGAAYSGIATHPEGAIPEERGFAAALAENAGALANNLEAIGVPNDVVEPVRMLGVAQQEGMAVEWAAGYSTGVVATTDDMVGVDRLVDQESWSSAYGHLDHLTRTAPDSEYTAMTGDVVLRDIDTALDNQTSDTPRGSDPERTTALLRDARTRVREILGREGA